MGGRVRIAGRRKMMALSSSSSSLLPSPYACLRLWSSELGAMSGMEGEGMGDGRGKAESPLSRPTPPFFSLG